MSDTVWALVVVAAAMAVATAYLVRMAVESRTRPQLWITLFLLAMMGEMWIAPVLYFSAPSLQSLVAGLGITGALMIASVVPVLVLLARFRQVGSPDDSVEVRPLRLGLTTAVFVAAVVLINEFLMSWGLGLVSGAVVIVGGAWGTFNAVVTSPWFLFTMAVEMFLTAAFLWTRLPRPFLAILLAQAGIMLFSPPALGGVTWPTLAVAVSSALMIGLFVYLFEYLYRHRQFSAALSTYLLELVGVYGLMMAGVFVWQYYGDLTTFAVAVVLEMVVVYVAVTRPDPFRDAPSTPWQLRPNWTFGLLSFVFVAELFMGAVLSVQFDPADYLGAFPFLPLSGDPVTILSNAFWNGFWFFATAAASTWFLIMMGLEMGALVVFKLRESKNPENRARLLMMMGCYGAFAVFYPSIYFALVFPNAPDASTVPVLGWSMGVGSYPLAISVLIVVALTYVILGVLTVLFGRRVVCSVFCTASLMYQGTTVDTMKSFNRSSPVARKYLSSRFSAAYSLTLGLVMVAFLGTAVLSYLNTIGVTNIYIQGTDPSVFFFIASFSVAWYVLFVAIPYVGNYNCVSMGWCYTGIIEQVFQKVGFFKLKVRDKQVCWDCKTLDCAKGCPVGLVDMPGHLRQTGVFRSTKCCGVGDCVEVCPYDNLYISDVRHTLRRVLGRPETRARRPPAPQSPAFGVRTSAATAGPGPVALLGSDAVLLPMVRAERAPRPR